MTIPDRARLHAGEKAFFAKVFPREGPRVIAASLQCTGLTLRGLARKTGLSPSYLSHVATGRIVISLGAYLTMAQEAVE